MKMTVKSGGWTCEYDMDDGSGETRSVGCRPVSYYGGLLGAWVDPEPMGYQRDVLGWQNKAGEEDQDQRLGRGLNLSVLSLDDMIQVTDDLPDLIVGGTGT